MPTLVETVFGGSPGKTWQDKAHLALFRAIRTFLQGVAGAFPAAGAGTTILTASYWKIFAYSVLAAFITALASFIQNAASIFDDPGQQDPGSP